MVNEGDQLGCGGLNVQCALRVGPPGRFHEVTASHLADQLAELILQLDIVRPQAPPLIRQANGLEPRQGSANTDMLQCQFAIVFLAFGQSEFRRQINQSHDIGRQLRRTRGPLISREPPPLNEEREQATDGGPDQGAE